MDTSNEAPKPFENLLAESKFRVQDAWQVRSICEERSAKAIGIDHQTDTYFRTPNGRLQLRESSHSGACLLSFTKDEVRQLPVEDPEALRKILTAQLGVKFVVRKRREIFLLEEALVNLDDVANLGFFLKFDGMFDEAERRLRPIGLARLFELQKIFQVTFREAERRSYYSLRKRSESENRLEFDAFTNLRLFAPEEGGALREVTRTETFVGAWE